jgi:hypothetical protein
MKQKKSLPMDERAVRSLAALTEGVDDFDRGLTAIVENLKPRIRQQWSRLRGNKSAAESRKKVCTWLSLCGVADPQRVLAEMEKKPLDIPKVIAALEQVRKSHEKEGS